MDNAEYLIRRLMQKQISSKNADTQLFALLETDADHTSDVRFLAAELPMVFKSGMVRTAEKIVALAINELEEDPLYFEYLATFHTPESISSEAISNLILNNNSEIPESLFAGTATLHKKISEHTQDGAVSIQRFALQVLNALCSMPERYFKVGHDRPVSFSNAFNQFISMIDAVHKVQSKSCEPLLLKNRGVFLKIANLTNELLSQSSSPKSELNLLNRAIEKLLTLNFDKAQWTPFLTAIPGLYGTPFIQGLLSKPINYHVYLGMTPVDLLLRSVDRAETLNVDKNLLASPLAVFQNMLDNGMTAEKFWLIIENSPRQNSAYPWERKCELQPHFWALNEPLMKAVTDWGVISLMPPSAPEQGASFRPPLLEKLTEGQPLSILDEARFKAVKDFPRIRRSIPVSLRVNGILNLLSRNIITDDHCERASEIFAKGEWIGDATYQNKHDLIKAILSGPCFETDRNAKTITDDNILCQLLFNFNPEMVRIAMSAGHDPYRPLDFSEDLKLKVSGAAKEAVTQVTDSVIFPMHNTLTFVELMSQEIDILKHYNNSVVRRDTPYSYLELADLLIDNAPPGFDFSLLENMLILPDAARLLISRNLVDFSPQNPTVPLSKILTQEWANDLEDNLNQDTFKNALKLAISSGYTLQDTVVPPPEGGSQTLEDKLITHFGEAGMAMFNAAQLDVVAPSEPRMKRRQTL